ncbi:MdtA/MuxA family multidrug efflux RND transporter periplasmic adaptor subunit [Paludibacterium purpuratum]|uniref:Multidrug efflux system membrane fusion protein n=1 Tax=Paludibacterium purpuratum TaxID=1144873 RepID=A0A4R7AXL2_9NEIS|nr:MdtA/MuxA family multidrug efflux RND transporter periplasmic adaptor subunit [Paludibacterium purpuratum]TDR72446.1 multidrug efflux system membrane fusion protein [Paludibacterium purpuratum]
MSPLLTKVLRQRAKGKFLLILLLFVLLAVWLVWRNQAANADAQRRGKQTKQVVTVASVAPRDMTIYLSALGTVTPNNTVTVRSRVDGQLMRLGFGEGQMVKAGQLLAELDPRPFQVALMQAEGQLARDQAQLKNAQIDLARYRTLLTQNSISQQQVATQEALVAQYQGTVMADRGAVGNAQLQLSYSRVTAPVSGRVGLKQVDLGNIVHASDSNGIVVITEMQPANVVFSLPEDQVSPVLPSVRANAVLPVEALDRDNRNKLADGRLLTVDNQVDTSTGTVKLKAVFANQDNALFPNQFVNVRLGTEQRKGALVIPLVALQRGQPGTFVYRILPDDTVALQVVRPGPVVGDLMIVEDGLKAGDRVVVDGMDRLRDGAKVIVASAKDSAAPGGGKHKAHGAK